MTTINSDDIRIVKVVTEGPQGSPGIAAADAPLYYDINRLAVGVNIGTTAGTVAAGNDSRFASLLARLDAFRDSRRIYISPDGNDANNGTSLGEPLRTFAAAAAAAQPGDLIEVGPGTYTEASLPIRWPRNVGILARGLRNTIIRPAAGQEFNDIFHVDSGFWVWGLQFAGHQSNQANNQQSWAIAFDALADNRSIGAVGLGAYILQSPYIQNCSSITAEDDAGLAGSQSVGDTGGGILVDGSRCAINSPIRSMVVDSYTQVNLGGPGCLVKNDGYAQLVSFFGTFCQYHVRTETGGQVNLSGGGTSDFGTYGLMADGYSPTPVFTGQARAQAFGAPRIEKAITIDASTDTFTATSHGLAAGDQVTFKVSSGTLPTPLNTTSTFFVIASGLGANTFKVSATEGGSSVDISGATTGTYQVVRQGVTSVDVINFNANRLSRQIKYPSAGSDGSPGNPVTISAVSGNSFTIPLDTVAGIQHTYVGGGTLTAGTSTYPVTACTYNNTTGVTTVTATGYTPTVGQQVVLEGLSFICNSASRPNAGQLMFPQLVFPRNATTGEAQTKTFTYTRTGTNTLTYVEAASPSGPEHEYVSGGTAVVSGNNLGVVNAVYNKTTGVVTLTTTSPVPAASGSVTVTGLAFICPTSAYVVTSSVPINASGVEVPNNDPTKAGYRVFFYNQLNGGLLNTLATGQVLDFRNRSQISAPGHTFEYVGSGTNYDALPFNGGVPVPGNKIVETNNGRVYSSNTDELGNFAVGDQFSVDGTTGSVTINTDQFNLSGLNFIGPFSRNGGFSTVGVQLQEVSNNTSLIASTGAPDANTVPTQFAVKEFTGSRYVTGVTSTAGQPISVTGSAQADGNGTWTYARNIELSLNAPNGLVQLDGSTLIPRALLPAATTAAQGALAPADKTKLDTLGTAAFTNSTAYATAAQGAKADTAVQPATLATELAGKADLVAGKVPTSQIPAIAVTDYLGAVANQAAMLALVGQRGDWCIRTDRSRAWVLSGDDASILGNWVELVTPADAVSSVNGQTGVVVLGPSDVGAATAAQGAKADTAVQPGSLGTAAAQNVGTSAGNVVQLDGAGKLPAVDGSALTGLPPSGVTSVSGTAPIVSSGGATPAISITAATTSAAGSMSAADKTKLDGIQAGAEVNVNADWNASSGDAQILNKPTLGTAAGLNVGTGAGNVVQLDGTGKLPAVDGSALTGLPPGITDLGYSASTRLLTSSTGTDVTLPLATTTDAGLMASADKSKLDGIAAGAQVNVATDLSYTASTRLLESSTGTDVTLPLFATNSTNAGLVPGSSTGGTTSFLRADGTWAIPPGGAPGGSDTQIQFNDGGAFGGDADLTYNKTTNVLTNRGDISLDDGGSFVTTLQTITPTANRTISLPDATGTVGLVAGSSGNLAWNNAGAYAGAANSTVDSSGNITIGSRLINNTAASLFDATSTTTQNNTGSPVRVTGTWVTSGGTGTTTKPTVLIEPTGTTSTAWSTAGTGLGVNAPSGFTGRLLDLQLNGTSRFSISSAGVLTVTSLAGVGTAGTITTSGLTMASDRLLGRSSAGTGGIEEIVCTAAGRALLDDADASAQRNSLGLGGAATLNVGVTAGTVAAGNDSRFVTARVDATTAQTIYTAQAPSGSSDSSAVWTITRTTYSTVGTRLTIGVATGVTWTGRTGHTYS